MNSEKEWAHSTEQSVVFL